MKGRAIKKDGRMSGVDSDVHNLPLPPLESAFMDASKRGDVKELTSLLRRGVSINTQDSGHEPRNQTALMYASEGGHIDAVRVLIAAGANVSARDRD
jgi:hypothetical protein